MVTEKTACKKQREKKITKKNTQQKMASLSSAPVDLTMAFRPRQLLIRNSNGEGADKCVEAAVL